MFLSENVMKRAIVCGGRGVFWIYVYRVPLKLKEKKRKLKDLTLHRILYFKVLEFSFKDGGRIFYLFFRNNMDPERPYGIFPVAKPPKLCAASGGLIYL